MKIWIIGLGYVGITSAACLAKLGHNIIGVETNSSKVKALKTGKNSIVEPGIDDLLLDYSFNISKYFILNHQHDPAQIKFQV